MKAKSLMMLAGIVLFGACKGSGDYATTDSVKTGSAKLVKTADMRIKVKDVQQVAEQVSKLTQLYGGIVMHHTMKANVVSNQDLQLSDDSIKKLTVYNTNADLVIKIPTAYIEPFMDSLNHFGTYVDQRQMDIEDRSIDYLSTKLKTENRQASVTLRKKIKLTQRGADSILTLKDDIVDKKISNLKTDDAVEYSTITLNLYQNNTIHAETVANDDLSNYKTPITTRAGLALSQGWSLFSGVVIELLNLWVFVLMVAVIWYAVIIYRRKRKAVV